MDIDKLNRLTEKGIISKLHIYDETSSTNDRAKDEIRSASENSDSDRDSVIQIPQLFISEVQTSGRGRMGRKWESKRGDGIWMSYLCKPDLSPDSISGITLVAGFIIAKSIRDYCSIHQINDISVNLKWPNDIIINRKKVCGILTELCSVPSGPDSYNSYVICGIGINVNTAGFDEELSDKATSLYIESGQSFDREELVILIITKLKEYIRKYEESKDLGFIIDEYNDMLINMNKEVILNTLVTDTDINKNTYNNTKNNFNTKNTRDIENTGERYISRGIDKTGALIVEDSCGNIKYVSSGEVSVRGVYGYV